MRPLLSRGGDSLNAMATESTDTSRETGTFRVKRGLAEMLKGGVIMDVVTAEQAKVAEDAGAVAVMALERVPADIRVDGGIARMSDPEMIEGIQAAVTIPVMAKARIGHFVEAQILEALGVDYVDESEVLTPADETHHIDKFAFTVPFVCGATNLGEALRRISEGACMIRSKGEAGTGNVVQAVRHLRSIRGDIAKIGQADPAELFEWAKQLQAPLPLVQEIADTGQLPVPLFCAGGLATPADAALAMQLGAEAVFVGSGIFKSEDPAPRAKAIVEATTNFRDPAILAKVSRGLGTPMTGIGMDELVVHLEDRGWLRTARPRGGASGSWLSRAPSGAMSTLYGSWARRPSRCASRPISTSSTGSSCPVANRRRCRSCSRVTSSSIRSQRGWPRVCRCSAPVPA